MFYCFSATVMEEPELESVCETTTPSLLTTHPQTDVEDEDIDIESKNEDNNCGNELQRFLDFISSENQNQNQGNISKTKKANLETNDMCVQV